MDKDLVKKKHSDQLPFSRCQEFIANCINKHVPIQWDHIAITYELPIWFIEQHINELNWNRLSRWQNFDESTIRYFQNHIDWSQLNPNDFSKDFIREFQNNFKFQYFALRIDLIDEFGDERYDEQLNKLEKWLWWKEHKNDFK